MSEEKAEEKTFDTLLVASASSGVMLTTRYSFSALHELCEWVMGHPIWTHEFAERPLWVRISEAIRAQHAEMPVNDGTELSLEEVASFAGNALELFGTTVTLKRGSSKRSESPLASAGRVMSGKTVGVVIVDGRDV